MALPKQEVEAFRGLPRNNPAGATRMIDGRLYSNSMASIITNCYTGYLFTGHSYKKVRNSVAIDAFGFNNSEIWEVKCANINYSILRNNTANGGRARSRCIIDSISTAPLHNREDRHHYDERV